MGINRTHLILITILSKYKATSAGTAITTEEIKNYCAIGKSDTTLHRAFRFLTSNGYIAQGVKDGKFFTGCGMKVSSKERNSTPSFSSIS